MDAALSSADKGQRNESIMCQGACWLMSPIPIHKDLIGDDLCMSGNFFHDYPDMQQLINVFDALWAMARAEPNDRVCNNGCRWATRDYFVSVANMSICNQ